MPYTLWMHFYQGKRAFPGCDLYLGTSSQVGLDNASLDHHNQHRSRLFRQDWSYGAAPGAMEAPVLERSRLMTANCRVSFTENILNLAGQIG
jgi:hypothetical protein